MKKSTLVPVALVCCILSTLVNVAAMGTAFTYQGRLNDGGTPANGSYVFRFSLYDQAISGGTVGTNITTSPVDVSNGLFTVTLDFGTGIFTGADRWLGIEVHTNQANLAFVPLTPLQPILPTPYAIYAGGVDAAGISGVVSSALSANLATNFSGALLGDVTGTQGATAVSAVGGQTATNVASGVSAANAATAAHIAGTIVKRDGNGNFSAGSATLNGALYLPFPAIIYAGTNTVMIAEGSYFAGLNAGRGAPASSRSVGVGDTVLSSLTTGIHNTGIGENALQANTTGADNTASGAGALMNNTTGGRNTATGSRALFSNAFEGVDFNSGGHNNTADGFEALYSNSSGSYNTASGFYALRDNTTGSYNTANGARALRANQANYSTANGASALEANTTGEANTANGSYALSANTIGEGNTATGFSALSGNTIGSYNTANGIATLQANKGSYNAANGSRALQANTTGSYNTANGANSLLANTTGGYNTANGYQALENNTNGYNNTANGFQALRNNLDGSYNTANGDAALKNNTSGGYNTASGFQALDNNLTGSFNIAMGFQAGTLATGDANIDIGNEGVAAESGTIRIGTQGTHTRAFIAGISGVTVASGVGVVVDSSGQLGITSSSARFKRDIQSMDDASDALLSLRPVTFRYKPELDPEAIPQFGLIAEEVEKVDPDLVARDDKGQVYTVRYEAVNAMLLNEFLKQHRKVEEQGAEIAVLRRKADKVDALEKRLNELVQTVQALATSK